MTNSALSTISGKGQLFKNGEFICLVDFHYTRIGDPSIEKIRISGEFSIEESKRTKEEILNGLTGKRLVLIAETGEKMEIGIFRSLGDPQDGQFMWLPWAEGEFPIR